MIWYLLSRFWDWLGEHVPPEFDDFWDGEDDD